MFSDTNECHFPAHCLDNYCELPFPICMSNPPLVLCLPLPSSPFLPPRPLKLGYHSSSCAFRRHIRILGQRSEKCWSHRIFTTERIKTNAFNIAKCSQSHWERSSNALAALSQNPNQPSEIDELCISRNPSKSRRVSTSPSKADGLLSSVRDLLSFSQTPQRSPSKNTLHANLSLKRIHHQK